MIRIYKAHHVIQAHMVRHLLDAAGIESRVFYDHAYGPGLGPYMQAGVWITDEGYEYKAKGIVDEYEASLKRPVSDVICSGCREINPDTFELCWHCGSDLLNSV